MIITFFNNPEKLNDKRGFVSKFYTQKFDIVRKLHYLKQLNTF